MNIKQQISDINRGTKTEATTEAMLVTWSLILTTNTLEKGTEYLGETKVRSKAHHRCNADYHSLENNIFEYVSARLEKIAA